MADHARDSYRRLHRVALDGKITWTNLQNKILPFIVSKGGQASILTPKIEHIKVELIYDLLKLDSPVDFAGCE